MWRTGPLRRSASPSSGGAAADTGRSQSSFSHLAWSSLRRRHQAATRLAAARAMSGAESMDRRWGYGRRNSRDRIVANAVARRRRLPSQSLRPGCGHRTPKSSRSWPPLICEAHDSFALRAVTAASAIAWPRLSDAGSATAGGVAAALMLATSEAPGDRDRQNNPRGDRIPQKRDDARERSRPSDTSSVRPCEPVRLVS